MKKLVNLNTQSTLLTLTAGALLLSLVACGGGGGTDVKTGAALPESSAIGSNQPVADDSSKPVEQITAATGVAIIFADDTQQNDIGGDYIEQQWVHMQNCLQITAQTPTVQVLSERISPITADDDVLRYIDGTVLATATVTSTDVTIQVTEADFDGSLGAKGDSLRSIMGRYLWFSASLPERDYSHNCANQ